MEVEVFITAIDDNFVKKSHYLKRKNVDLIGIKIYRNDRDITQLGAQKWDVIDPSTKMYRDVGLRIRMNFNGDINQCNHFDEDFKVSSLKCIDEPSYYHYEESLKNALKTHSHKPCSYNGSKIVGALKTKSLISQPPRSTHAFTVI